MNTKNLDRLLQHFTDIGPKGCGAVVTHHGNVVYEGYAGYADAENAVAAGKDTVYRIYSCTKVFTAVAVLQLYEKGFFLLNDPIERYLPEFAGMKVNVAGCNGAYKHVPAERPITILDLLSMRSGLTYGGNANPTELETAAALEELEIEGGYCSGELMAKLAKIPLAFQPGSRFCYGLSHDVLSALVERLSGKSFGAYLRDAIFKPLGMKHTAFFIEEIQGGALAQLYTWAEEHTLVPDTGRDEQFHGSHKWESGGSGLLSSVADMARFATALSMGGSLDGVRILGRKTIDLMRRNQLEGQSMKDFEAAWENGWEFLRGYGYGLGVRTLMRPEIGGINGTMGEFGWAGMAGTYLLADPEEQLAIAYGHQIYPNNMEGYCHPRLKQAVYGLLE